ncbi:MAG: phosphoribosylglycinamide formyltransferase [Acidimicrobiaceae bacterium]|nr:phosphoribosylglycinamide formyltransferase [Acidimicrobiaceae bacterium]
MRIAVLASGSGTILQAIIQASIPLEVLVTDRECRAEKIAAQNNLTHIRIKRDSYGKDFNRDAYTCEVRDTLIEHKIDLVAMAGFGTILNKPIYEDFNNRILNTHPSLLPSFPGWHAVEEALTYGVKVTGCTVHIATEEVDAGPILAQEAIQVLKGDTKGTLHERIKEVERRLYIDTLKNITTTKEL